MSLAHFVYPLRIRCSVSHSLRFILVAIHLLATFLVLSFHGATLSAVVLLLMLLLSFLQSWRWHLNTANLVWLSDGRWEVRLGSSEPRIAELQRSTVSTRFVIFLHLRSERGKRLDYCVTRDSLPAETFRRLRLRLLVEGGKTDRDSANPEGV